MTHVTREVFWNIPGVFRTVFYASAVLASGLFISGIWVKFSVWLRGKDNPDDIVYGMRGIELARMSLKGLFSKECFFAKRVFEKSRVRGVVLVITIWSFLTLFMGTVILSLDYDLRLNFLNGMAYLVYSMILDIAGALLGICIIFYLGRRYVFRSENIVSSMDDAVILCLLLLIIITGFSTEGLRLAYFRPPSMDWSPVGYLFARVFEAVFGGIASSYILAHRLVWLSHAASALSFIAYIPFSKQFHMFSAQIVTSAAIKHNEKLRGILHEG